MNEVMNESSNETPNQDINETGAPETSLSGTPATSTPATGTKGSDQLRQYVERIERLEEEKRALMSDVKDVYAEAKASGFEPKIMRQIIKLRTMDKDVLAEQDDLLATYRSALGLL